MDCSCHNTSFTNLTFKLLTEPAEVLDVVLNLSFTVEIVFPASEVRSNFRKVFCTGVLSTYRVVLVPPAVEAGLALSIYVSAMAMRVAEAVVGVAVGLMSVAVGLICVAVGLIGVEVGTMAVAVGLI